MLPVLPLDVFQLCVFQRWRPGEITSTVLSLLYGSLCSQSPDIRIATIIHLFVKDALAFIIIVFSSKRRSTEHAYGTPNLLDRVVRDATLYFFVIFSSHLLLIFFEFLAPVSGFLTDFTSSTANKLRKRNPCNSSLRGKSSSRTLQ